MKRMLPVALSAACLFGCRTHPVTPEESWSDYGRYYSATSEAAVAPEGVAEVRIVKSGDAKATVESFTSQGYVVLGSFKIDDGTEISARAVDALAKKLNAGAVVWCQINTLPSSARATANPDLGIVGVDTAQMVHMNADRPDQSFSEQVIETHHTIWMLGKRAK